MPGRNTHLSLGNSHLGSSGSSYSETPASIGVSAAEDRRVVILTSGVLEFMEELDSAETWIQNAKTDVTLAPPGKARRQPEPSQSIILRK